MKMKPPASTSAVNPEAPDPYEVGYAKPPVATRFKPGQSGNPRGRPKGSKSKASQHHVERVKDIIIDVAYRNVPINDRGKIRTVSLVEANVTALALSGAKGNHRAADLFTTAVLNIESERRELYQDHIKTVLTYKEECKKALAAQKGRSIAEFCLYPHPDDIKINFAKGTVEIRGPADEEEEQELVSLLEMKNSFALENSLFKRLMRVGVGADMNSMLEQQVASNEELIANVVSVLNKVAGPKCLERLEWKMKKKPNCQAPDRT